MDTAGNNQWASPQAGRSQCLCPEGLRQAQCFKHMKAQKRPLGNPLAMPASFACIAWPPPQRGTCGAPLTCIFLRLSTEILFANIKTGDTTYPSCVSAPICAVDLLSKPVNAAFPSSSEHLTLGPEAGSAAFLAGCRAGGQVGGGFPGDRRDPCCAPGC